MSRGTERTPLDLKQIRKRLERWAMHKALAQGNPSLLLRERHSEEATDLCVKRMNNLHRAEAALEEAQGSPDIPKALQRWLDIRSKQIGENAGEGMGCKHCWLSAHPPEHVECAKLMKEFFNSDEDLYKWVVGCDVRPRKRSILDAVIEQGEDKE